MSAAARMRADHLDRVRDVATAAEGLAQALKAHTAAHQAMQDEGVRLQSPLSRTGDLVEFLEMLRREAAAFLVENDENSNERIRVIALCDFHFEGRKVKLGTAIYVTRAEASQLDSMVDATPGARPFTIPRSTVGEVCFRLEDPQPLKFTYVDRPKAPPVPAIVFGDEQAPPATDGVIS